ncbi:MAG TPA: hypothetical protein VGF92_15830 [Stellaceae bacterium]|jgi:hypothetical protein
MPFPGGYSYPGVTDTPANVAAILGEIQVEIAAAPPALALDLSLAAIPFDPVDVPKVDSDGHVVVRGGVIVTQQIAGLTDAQKVTRLANLAYLRGVAATLAGKTTPVDVDVPAGVVMDTLMVSGAWPPIELLVAHGTPSGQKPPTANDLALGAAIALVRLCTATPGSPFRMSDATTKAAVTAQLGALVAAGVVQPSDQDAVLALSSGARPWLAQYGWPSDVALAEHDIEAFLINAQG